MGCGCGGGRRDAWPSIGKRRTVRRFRPLREDGEIQRDVGTWQNSLSGPLTAFSPRAELNRRPLHDFSPLASSPASSGPSRIWFARSYLGPLRKPLGLPGPKCFQPLAFGSNPFIFHQLHRKVSPEQSFGGGGKDVVHEHEKSQILISPRNPQPGPGLGMVA